MTRINGWACFFLVSLRLVIGWHFLVEGVHKIHSHQVGKTATNTPWTSEGFFKEGYGPAATLGKQLVDDSPDDIQRKYKSVDGKLPEFIAASWEPYFDTTKTDLSPEQQNQAQEIYSKAKQSMVAWLNGEFATPVTRTLAWGPVDLKQSVPQRLAAYEVLVGNIADAYAKELPAFNRDVEHARLRAMKAEAAKILADLDVDIAKRSAEMQSAVESVKTDQQRNHAIRVESVLIKNIVTVDKITMWTHAVLGALLLVGLFTRLSSVLLAMFLLSVTLIAPAVPWAPAPPGAVGHYLYINLYTIEMIALLALACMPTGRWFGVDSLIDSILRPRRAHLYTPGRVHPVSARR